MRASTTVALACMLLGASLVGAKNEQASLKKQDGETAASPKMEKVEVKGFTFRYRVDGDNLVAKLSYPTTGWVSVGFNPTKKMLGANIIIGSAEGEKGTVADHYGIKQTRHAPDVDHGGKSDLADEGCEEKKGKTTMWFTIPLNSGDTKDGVLETGKEVKVIFAAGKKDSFGKHSWLGKTTITL